MWRDRRTALQIAAALWEHDVVQTLLGLGADPTSCSPNGYTALHWLLYREEPFDKEKATKIRSNRQLREFQMGQPRFQKSRIAASVKALSQPLSTQISAIDLPCSNGKTPLMFAVRDSPTATKTLLDEGAEPDKRDDRGRTALMHFFLGNFNGRSISILKHLLHAGADSQASNSSGKTVLGYWARRVTSTAMSNLYAGSNSYNKVFHMLASLGALSQRDALVQELTSLHVPLVVASRLGNAQLCWALLDTGTNPDKHGIAATSPLGRNDGSEANDLEDLAWNPVLVALWAKAYVTAAILLAYGADVGFRVPKRKRTKYNEYGVKKVGITPLHLAVGGDDRGDWYGTDVVLCGVSKRSALEMLAKQQKEGYEEFRARENDVESSDSEYEITKFVFSNDSTGAEKVPFDTLFGSTFSPEAPCDPLLEAVISKHQTPAERQEALAEYMLRSGASVNARTQEGITPLLASVGQGRLDLARLLLKHGADPNIAAVGGCTPLMIAARNGRRDLVEALLASGADPDAQLDALAPGECSCATFISWSHFTFSNCHAPLSALVVAAEREHYDTVETLLAHGADANLPIVHHAHGRVPSRRERRRREVDDTPSSSDTELEPKPERWEGRISVGTALTWARGEVRDLLLRHGADPSKEEAIRKCDCPTIGKRKERGLLGRDSDDDYPTNEESDSSTDLPWRRRRSRIKSSSDDNSSMSS
ncbi:Uncharacterized protein TPAR_04084 [Tolypocladium paradoxum]|uniref:Uncharacterized protein n=1 Tax=Tolypocladium paradoxum TaxID=94208 RepID=A0A2S4KZW4_9HYPO|nr:Uncharacterized protein TPAR_04084 [Tolypocladium paradoxum]